MNLNDSACAFNITFYFSWSLSLLLYAFPPIQLVSFEITMNPLINPIYTIRTFNRNIFFFHHFRHSNGLLVSIFKVKISTFFQFSAFVWSFRNRYSIMHLNQWFNAYCMMDIYGACVQHYRLGVIEKKKKIKPNTKTK